MARFWVWRQQRFAKLGELDLPWPYLTPEPVHVGPIYARQTTHVPATIAVGADKRSLVSREVDYGDIVDLGIPARLVELVTGEPAQPLPDQPGYTARGHFQMRMTQDFHVLGVPRPIGAMFAAVLWLWSVRTPQRLRFNIWVTPPLYMFADLSATSYKRSFDPNMRQFWVQPEVFEATGELLQGEGPRQWIEWTPAQAMAFAGLPDGLTETVMIALDSFLEKRVVDPRFGGAQVKTRPPKARAR